VRPHGEQALSEVPEISIIVPVRDEAESVVPLHEEILSVMGGLGRPWELIVVDDGSRDATFARGRDLRARHVGLRLIRFARPFGKSSALAAGFAAARGSIIITLDGDLQDDPSEIPRFLAAFEQGYDLVSGWKRRRRDPLSKRWSSRLFNAVVARIAGLPLHDFNCGFKAYRAPVVRDLRLRRGLHRFIPLLAKAAGYRVGEIAVGHRPRPHGRSKYGWERVPQALVELHLAMLVAYRNERPLRTYGVAGAALLVPGAVVVATAPPGPPIARWLWMGAGLLWLVVGAHFLLMAALTARALAREPHGAAYSIAEQLD